MSTVSSGSVARPALGRDPAAWVLFILACAVYVNTLRNGFTLDDHTAVAANSVVRGAFSLRALFTHDYWGYGAGEPTGGLFRPLPTLTYALDWHLGHGAPWVFHLTNTVLHAVATVVFYRVFAARIPDRRAGFLAGALFAVHPLHTEAVASVVGRADVLGFLFSASLWWLHPRSSRLARVGAVLSFLAAVLCKESAVLMLPLLAFRDGVTAPPPRPWPWRDLAARYGAYGCVVAAYAGIRMSVTGSLQGYQINQGVNALAGASFVTREVSAMRLFARALELLIGPTDLMPLYGSSMVHPSRHLDAHVALAVGMLAFLVATGLRTRKTRPAIAEAVAWMLLPGLAAVNAFVPYSAAFGERLWYLPSAGALALVGYGLAWLSSRGSPWMGVAAGVIPVLLFVPLTLERNREWHDDEILFTMAVITHPDCAGCHYVLGNLALETRQGGDAIEHCGAAARLAPDWGSAQGCYATSLANGGHTQEAAVAYRAMLARGRTRPEWTLRYVAFLVQQGQRADAEALLARLRAQPMNHAQRAKLEQQARAMGAGGSR